MSTEKIKPLELANLAISLLHLTNSSLSVIERLEEATILAYNLLHLSEQTLEKAATQEKADYEEALMQVFNRPAADVKKLPAEEVRISLEIRDRFIQVAGGKTHLNEEQFLKGVLLPGRNHQIKTLRTAWLGFEAHVGEDLQFDISTAVKHGPKFIQDCAERLSTHLKHGNRVAAKKAGRKGGNAKARMERKRHGPAA